MKALSGREFARLVERRGWRLLRISGSHHIYGKTGSVVRLSIPIHGNRPLKRRSGGICLVALVPHAVQSVMQGRIIRLAWAGHPGPRVSEIDQAKDA